MPLGPDELAGAHRVARGVAERLRLAFGQQKGLAGNWLGVGIGSSIDYQDHRPFLPGDDPRYLDWKAYARTGQFTMKVYREEITPQIDLVVDVSTSMFFTPEKLARTLELIYFVVESGLRVRASMAIHTIARTEVRRLAPDDLLGHQVEIEPVAGATAPPDLHRVPVRSRSLRVLISDLLFPGEARSTISTLIAKKGQGLLLAPFVAAEANPDWEGNRELVDVETEQARVQRMTSGGVARYREAYTRHFQMWREECRRHDVVLGRVDAERDLEGGLAEAVAQGAVLPWH